MSTDRAEVGASMLGVLLHIALDVLLASGQPLDAALLFAMNNLGGQNCTKVFLFKVNLCYSGYAPWAVI